MFYCNECADKKEYPRSWSKSYGRCEICKRERACNDIPSKDLPEEKEALQNEK